ncbi:MAG: DUF3299 domain-containing protein [Candidatus Hydrogenedentes bacterium]|nr:DUF3299 domain-containing protein [Candidatus Hydrogenedentota bacterium]
MKKRTKRDIGIFLGVIALIGGVALANSQFRRGNLAQQYERLRAQLESGHLQEGMNLLPFNLLRKTKGSLTKGGTFAADLFDYNNQPAHMIGFMVPQETFIDVSDFMMLPIPIECYFCAMPPARDVLYVHLQEGETAQIYAEPVLILGTFKINEGPGQKYFYSITDATIRAAEDDGELTRRRLKLQHMLPVHERDPDLLLEPYNPDDDTD